MTTSTAPKPASHPENRGHSGLFLRSSLVFQTAGVFPISRLRFQAFTWISGLISASCTALVESTQAADLLQLVRCFLRFEIGFVSSNHGSAAHFRIRLSRPVALPTSLRLFTIILLPFARKSCRSKGGVGDDRIGLLAWFRGGTDCLLVSLGIPS